MHDVGKPDNLIRDLAVEACRAPNILNAPTDIRRQPILTILHVLLDLSTPWQAHLETSMDHEPWIMDHTHTFPFPLTLPYADLRALFGGVKGLYHDLKACHNRILVCQRSHRISRMPDHLYQKRVTTNTWPWMYSVSSGSRRQPVSIHGRPGASVSQRFWSFSVKENPITFNFGPRRPQSGSQTSVGSLYFQDQESPPRNPEIPQFPSQGRSFQ